MGFMAVVGALGGGKGVSKKQAAAQARAEADRAVKKAEEPQPGDLLKKYNTQASEGHTAVDAPEKKKQPGGYSTRLDEEQDDA